HLGGAHQAHLVAFDAPAGDIGGHLPDEGPEAVVVLLNQRQPDLLEVVPDRVPAAAVLGEGMDIGIIPEAGDLVSLLLEGRDGPVGAGSAADVQQQLHRFPSARADARANLLRGSSRSANLSWSSRAKASA